MGFIPHQQSTAALNIMAPLGVPTKEFNGGSKIMKEFQTDSGV
jgi:hypothetical protein